MSQAPVHSEKSVHSEITQSGAGVSGSTSEVNGSKGKWYEKIV